jgi:hypothetical protein
MKNTQTMTDVLRQAMKESGLSIYAAAKGAGLVQQSLQRFMAGTQSLRLDKADALAAYLGLELVRTKPLQPKPRKGR